MGARRTRALSFGVSFDNVRSLGNQGRELLRTIPGSSSERYRLILGYIRICTNEVKQHHDACIPNMFWTVI